MEKLKFEYSYKNIPIPSVRSYKLYLLEKIEMVIKRMRWKAYFFNKKDENNEIQETYGLKSLNCPPQIKELSAFEDELFNLINILKFRKIRSAFQNKLKEDIKTINEETKTLTFADKTTNMYKLTKEEYNKFLKDSITTTYKMVNDNINKRINIEGKNIIKNTNIAGRILTNGKDESFITLKDHKPNFQNNPKTRLINPAKNEIGRLSKSILDRINKELKEITKVNQWKDTAEVLKWFSNIEEKSKHKFIVFDIKDFYPSISKTLLNKALKFAK